MFGDSKHQQGDSVLWSEVLEQRGKSTATTENADVQVNKVQKNSHYTQYFYDVLQKATQFQSKHPKSVN